MIRMLSAARVPKRVIDLIPLVVQTCRVCRRWIKPLPANVATIPDKLNEKVECEIFFIYEKVVFAMVSVCIRWLHTVVIPDKDEDSIITSIDSRGWAGRLFEVIMGC